MVYKIEITQSARQDMKEYADYIGMEHTSPEAARRWLREIQEGIRALRLNPTQFSVISEADELARPFRSFHHKSHRVIFSIDEEQRVVTVRRVYHGARRPVAEGDL